MKMTKPQRRALAVLGAYQPLGARCAEIAIGMWARNSAAHAGKAASLMRRMETAGLVARVAPKTEPIAAYWAVTKQGYDAFHCTPAGQRAPSTEETL